MPFKLSQVRKIRARFVNQGNLSAGCLFKTPKRSLKLYSNVAEQLDSNGYMASDATIWLNLDIDFYSSPRNLIQQH